jgi:hypothetical protein
VDLLSRIAFGLPFSASSRILFASWWIFVQVLTSFYTAELTAFLTLTDTSLPIKNFDDFKVWLEPIIQNLQL